LHLAFACIAKVETVIAWNLENVKRDRERIGKKKTPLPLLTSTPDLWYNTRRLFGWSKGPAGFQYSKEGFFCQANKSVDRKIGVWYTV
jgi:hypothetical protein